MNLLDYVKLQCCSVLDGKNRKIGLILTRDAPGFEDWNDEVVKFVDELIEIYENGGKR